MIPDLLYSSAERLLYHCLGLRLGYAPQDTHLVRVRVRVRVGIRVRVRVRVRGALPPGLWTSVEASDREWPYVDCVAEAGCMASA